MNNIVKSVVFAAVVLFAGIAAMQVIYKNTDPSADITAIEPAAGDVVVTETVTEVVPSADAIDAQKDLIDAEADAAKAAVDADVEAAKADAATAVDAAEATAESADAAVEAVEEGADAQKDAIDAEAKAAKEAVEQSAE